jgi:hypothetical protein
MLSQRWNYFLVWSVNDEMRSSYAQPAMKFIPGMLSIFWMMFLKWVVISSYAEHAWKLVTRWLSMRGNWLLVGWASAEIGYSWLSIRRYSFYWYWTMSFPCLNPLSLSHVSVHCFPSTVPCLTSLFLVSHPLFPVSLLCSLFPAFCLPFIFPNLKSLFLLSDPPF